MVLLNLCSQRLHNKGTEIKPISTPQDIMEDIPQTKIAIRMDDEDRLNQGDPIRAAEHMTPARINFMAKPWSRTHLLNAHERAVARPGFKNQGAR